MEESKKPWLSKTVWLGIVTGVAPFIPGVSEWVSTHVAEIGLVWGALAIALRLVTKEKVKLID